MDKPILLDLFCKAGGCTRGYQMAGFRVVGVDIEAQPRYVGDAFVRADALEYVAAYGHEYDAIHASPPCQAHSALRTLHGDEYRERHLDLIPATRDMLVRSGKPYVIENVMGAVLENPIMLTGTMFELGVFRPRLFETNFPVPFMLAPMPMGRHTKLGHKPKEGEFVHVVGHAPDVGFNRRAMGIEWMSQGELAQAIPPAYTAWIGQHLMDHLIGVPA